MRLADGDVVDVVDVVDAHVALTTRVSKSLVFTSDPNDMARCGVAPSPIRKL